jgi:hypothetical protein
MLSRNAHRLVLGAFVLIAAIAVAASARPARADRPLIFGINPTWGEWLERDPDTYDPAMMDMIHEAGGTNMRSGFDWCNMEPTRGNYVWSEYDRRVDLALSRGIQWVGLICVTPAWASPTGQITHQWPPKEEYAEDFRNFCRALAQHYRGRVYMYEFWNEANNMGWHQAGRPDEYTPWLIRAYTALKEGDPDCLVSTTGLDGGDTGFLEGIYTYGGQNYFDAVALHPYSSGPISTTAINNIRNVMVAHGDGNKPMWLTEYGWWIGDPAVQAANLQASLDILSSDQYWFVSQASYHTISDWDPTCAPTMGLCNCNLVPRQAYYTFQNYPRPQHPAISNVRATGITPYSAIITWQTDEPATSQVEYGTTAAYGSSTSLDSSLVTNHSVTVTGLQAYTTYHYRVVSSVPGYPTRYSSDYTLTTISDQLLNGDFEGGFHAEGTSQVPNAWTHFPGFTKYDGATDGRVHTGAHSLAWWTDYGPVGEEGGVYQTVYVSPGVSYRFSVWVNAEDGWNDGGQSISSQIGIDPTGGTDANGAAVVWSTPAWYGGAERDNNVWYHDEVTATAQGNRLTVFMMMHLQRSQIHRMYWDDAALESAGTPCTSPPGWLTGPGWALMSIPNEPTDGDPATVFGSVPIDGRLYRYDPGASGYVAYQAADPGPFGAMDQQTGCWLYLDGPGQVSYMGAPISGDQTIALATPGWHLIGCPAEGPVLLADVQVTNTALGLTVGFGEASQTYAWVNSPLYWYDHASGGYGTCGLDPWASESAMVPWKGYWICTSTGDLELTFRGT